MRFRFLSNAMAAALVWLTLAIPLHAQTTTTQTSLAAAVNGTQTTVTLASATGVEAGGNLFVDRELMSVNSVSGTTITVTRGAGGYPSTHQSGALVWVANRAQNASVFRTGPLRTGTCTATNEPYLPQINVPEGVVQNCNCISRTTGVCTAYVWGGPATAPAMNAGISVHYVTDANYTAQPADTMIVFGTLAASRVVTLPAASVPGKILIIADGSGTAGAAKTITAAGTISGATTYAISTGGGVLRMVWSGSAWYVW